MGRSRPLGHFEATLRSLCCHVESVWDHFGRVARRLVRRIGIHNNGQLHDFAIKNGIRCDLESKLVDDTTSGRFSATGEVASVTLRGGLSEASVRQRHTSGPRLRSTSYYESQFWRSNTPLGHRPGELIRAHNALPRSEHLSHRWARGLAMPNLHP